MEKITPLMGTWLQIGNPIVAEIAAYKDFDWICVDLEHSPTTIETMGNMFRAIRAANKDVMLTVRVPDHDPKTISRCLDVGAECLIVPQVNTYEQALDIVKAAKYPPIGERGCGFAQSNRYGSDDLMENICTIIVQVEHWSVIRKEKLERGVKSYHSELEKIINHPHIDGAFIGPLDLEASLPSNQDRKHQVHLLMEIFKDIMSMHRKYIGIHIIDPSSMEVARVIRAGYNFIALGVDTSLLSQSMTDLFNREDM